MIFYARLCVREDAWPCIQMRRTHYTRVLHQDENYRIREEQLRLEKELKVRQLS